MAKRLRSIPPIIPHYPPDNDRGAYAPQLWYGDEAVNAADGPWYDAPPGSIYVQGGTTTGGLYHKVADTGAASDWQGITGTVNSTVGIYNVLDYGAVGDGTTDDAAAIDAAMAAASAAGGGTVWLPAGTYILGTVSARGGSDNSYIVANSNVNVIGMGAASILKVKTGETPGTSWNVIYSSQLVQNAIYADFVIDGGVNLLTSGDAARANTFIGSTGGGYNIQVRHVTFQNEPGANTLAFSGTTGTRGQIIVDGCRFLEVGSGLTDNYNTDHTDIYLLGANNKVLNCYFASTGHVAGAAWENHGIDFEAAGNYVKGYNVAFWITSEDGNCHTSSYHDNVFMDVYRGLAFSAGEDNGFGRVDYYNNVVHLAATASGATTGYYLLYGPDSADDTADELNIHDCRFYGFSGTDVNLLGTIGASRVKFYNNHAEYFDYGVIISASAYFASATYAHMYLEIAGNTFHHITRPISELTGGTLYELVIDGNRFTVDSTIHQIVMALNTTATTGRITDNHVAASAYDTDLALAAAMRYVYVEHVCGCPITPTDGPIGAKFGSRIVDPPNKRTLVKLVDNTATWHATTYGSTVPTSGYWSVGDWMHNTGTGDTIGWRCTVGGYGGTWKYLQGTLEG